MRAQNILKNCAIIFLMICVVILAIDVFKMLKINIDFMGMQSSDRISSSSNADEVRYEPTDYIITNKDDALEEIKKIALGLKADYMESNSKENIFEIGNIHKIENFFYTYRSYAVVKYKLLNIIEDLPKLYSATKGYDNSQLNSYFDNNIKYIEKCYGITNSEEFINLAKSLDFLGSNKIDVAVLKVETIKFDYDNDILTFNLRVKGNEIETYFVRVDYYKSSDNQVKPYVKFVTE